MSAPPPGAGGSGAGGAAGSGAGGSGAGGIGTGGSGGGAQSSCEPGAGGTAWTCSGPSGGYDPEGCSLAWQCDCGPLRIDCVPVPGTLGAFTCTCFQGETRGRSAESSTICASEAVLRESFRSDVNVACDWRIE